MEHEEKWLSVEQVADYLGVKPDTVYTWISKKDLPAHKVGRLWKMKAREIDEWVRTGHAVARSAQAGRAGSKEQES